MPCHLPYIPERLHTNGRPDLHEFTTGEFLFRKCKATEVENPFFSISLVDISVNRGGTSDNVISLPDDVLFNMNPEKNGNIEKLPEAITAVEIRELNENFQYLKEDSFLRVVNNVEENHVCRIFLKHKKEECNYAHCAFEIYYDGVEMTFENYDTTLKRDKHAKSWCKNELVKMIIKEEIWITWPNGDL